MATTWDTYPLVYMGTMVLFFTIVCSRKHTPFPTSNKLPTKWIEGDEKDTTYTQTTKSLRWFLQTFYTNQRFYKGSK
jgi:hypothetical protein